MLHLPIRTSAALICLFTAGFAQAEVSFARRGKLAGVVEIKNKTAGTVYHIWQSSETNQNRFEDTGFTITAGSNGKGKRTIPNNDANSLMLDHYIKIGDANGPNDQPAHVVEHPAPMHPGMNSGFNAPQIMTLSQSIQVGPDIMTESWNPNTIFSLSLNPSQATWLNMGCTVQGQGDLQVQLLQISPQNIVFRIIGDPTMTTLDNVIISGVGMQVRSPACGSVGITLGYQGSTNIFFNGEFLQNVSGSGQYEYDRYIVDGFADFNGDGTIDFFDYLDFVDAFSSNVPAADFNRDGVIDFFDYLDFVDAFSTGC